MFFFSSNHFNFIYSHSTSFYFLIDILTFFNDLFFIGKTFRNPQAVIYRTKTACNAAAPFVASFSSRGPANVSPTILKVTICNDYCSRYKFVYFVVSVCTSMWVLNYVSFAAGYCGTWRRYTS